MQPEELQNEREQSAMRKSYRAERSRNTASTTCWRRWYCAC